jgi:hypothetical protein
LICGGWSTATSAVLGWYETYLGRCADPSGFAYWTNQYVNGSSTPAQIQNDLATSSEAADYAAHGINDGTMTGTICPFANYHYQQYTIYCVHN